MSCHKVRALTFILAVISNVRPVAPETVSRITNSTDPSSSNNESKWRLLSSFLHPTTKHLNRLGDILVYSWSSIKTMADCVQLTQGESMLKLQCQSTVVGGACAKWSHIDPNLRTARSETVLMIYGDLKKSTWWIFIIIRWLYTHTANTHLCSNTM